MRSPFRWPLVAAAALLLPGNFLPEPDLEALATVSEDELAEQRGGFAWNGMEISFGAEISTWLADELVLHTIVSWDGAGKHVEQTVSGKLDAVDAAALQNGILSTGNITIAVGDATVFLANEGQTALMHQTDGSLRNVLINTASNISARQQVDATIDLSGYDAFRADIMGTRAAAQLHETISFSASGHFGH